jgi:hypothetical protein
MSKKLAAELDTSWMDNPEVKQAIATAKAKIDKIRFEKLNTEGAVENYLKNEVEKAGGWAVKFNPTGHTGLPDRIIFYKGLTWLVEAKSPRGHTREHQKAKHAEFAKYGFRVRIVKNKTQVDEFINDMLIGLL